MTKWYLDLRKGKTGRNFCDRWIYHPRSRALLEMPALGVRQIQSNKLRVIFHNKWKDKHIWCHINKHDNDNMINTAFKNSTSIKTNLLLITPHFSTHSVIEASFLPIIWLLGPQSKSLLQRMNFRIQVPPYFRVQDRFPRYYCSHCSYAPLMQLQKKHKKQENCTFNFYLTQFCICLAEEKSSDDENELENRG